MTREEVDAGLWRLLVLLERAACLDEWRPNGLSADGSPGRRSVSATDQHGRELDKAA